jgi:hypothetical protein
LPFLRPLQRIAPLLLWAAHQIATLEDGIRNAETAIVHTVEAFVVAVIGERLHLHVTDWACQLISHEPALPQNNHAKQRTDTTRNGTRGELAGTVENRRRIRLLR